MADNRDDEGFGTTARGDGAQHRRDALPYLGAAAIGGNPADCLGQPPRPSPLQSQIPFKAPAVDQNEIARDLMRRTQAAVLRITGIPATYLSQDALIAELQAANARLRTEVEALRVERDEARSRLVSAAETIRKLATGEPAMWSDGKKVEVRGVYPPIRADRDEAWHDARMTGTGWLRVTQPEPEAPSTAAHSKPFPAKAMR